MSAPPELPSEDLFKGSAVRVEKFEQGYCATTPTGEILCGPTTKFRAMLHAARYQRKKYAVVRAITRRNGRRPKREE